MANHNFPGVYPTITDLSQVVSANAVTSCAYVGEAEFGPINTPTLISNLKNYTERFGALSPKFGYMGYSLAVAADTINNHYVVRVVDEETAKYAAKFIALTDKTAKEYTSGFSIEEVKAAQQDSNSLFVDPTSGEDSNDAFVIVASNPNNKTIKVTVKDTTINTNRNLLTTKTSKTTTYAMVTLSETDVYEQNDKVVLTVDDTKTFKGSVSELNYTYMYEGEVKVGGENYTVGDIVKLDSVVDSSGQPFKVKITSIANGAVTGIELMTVSDTVTLAKDTAYATLPVTTTSESAAGLTIKISQTSTQNVYKVTFNTPISNEEVAATWNTVRILKLMDDNETTFGIEVWEIKGKVSTKVEQYTYCTLYAAKDSNGNSTYVEDVINGKSAYIQVFANTTSNIPTYPRPASVTLEALEGGTSGTPLSKASNSTDAFNKGWDTFADRTEVTVSLLMNSGYAYESNLAYQSKMVEIAEKRRDCFALLDVPQTLAASSDKVLDWRKNVLGMNTYRASLTTPWVRTYDSVQGKSGFLMCPSAYVAKIMGMSDPWIAAAGPNRGILSSATVSPLGLTESYDDTVGGTLYDNQLNCIVRNPGAGWAVWGQKTLQQKPSALDRINVARTVIYIETTLRDAARYHLFENNTAFERMQITLQFNQFLDQVLSSGGIQKYQVVCDETNNTPYIIANNTLVIDIYIWPTYTTEFIELNTIVMGADANVSITSNA